MSIRTSLNLMLHDDAQGPEPLVGSGINPDSSQLIEWPQQNKQWQMRVICLYSPFQPAFILGKHHLMVRDKANLLLIMVTLLFAPKLDNGICFDFKGAAQVSKLQSTTKEDCRRLLSYHMRGSAVIQNIVTPVSTPSPSLLLQTQIVQQRQRTHRY